MSGQKKQPKGSKYLSTPFHSTSDSNVANAPTGGSASGHSNSGSQSSQSLVQQGPQQGPQQAALPLPAPSRSRRFFRRLGFSSSPSPPPPPGVAPHSVTTVHHTATSASPVVPSVFPRPCSSHSESSAQQIHSPLIAGGIVTAITAVPSVDCGSPSPPDVKGSSFTPVIAPPVSTASLSTSSVSISPVSTPAPPVSAPSFSVPPVSGSPVSASPVSASPASTSLASASPASASPASASPASAPPGAIKPPSVVWTKTLEIVEEKLRDNELPPLDTTNLTSESAKENIGAVIKSLNALQEDKQKKKWSYTWRGEKVIIAERLGEILRSVGPYTKIVDTVIQCDPQVSALVWGGIQAIIQVTLNHTEAIEGFEVAIAALVEKISLCEFYSEIYNGVVLPSQSTENRLQLQTKLDSALPELYAAVIVFSVKAATYFQAKGIKKISSKLKPFNLEFQPFIEEVNSKEGGIRECADAATMDRVKAIQGALQHITSKLEPLAKLNDISTTATEILKVAERIQDNTTNDRILELLITLTPLEPLKRHQDVKSLRAENTGTWLLELESFGKWHSDITEKNNSVFCCYGIPGAGKTTICSAVIDNLYFRYRQHPSMGIACLYADYKDQNSQTLVNILGSFLHQLLTTTTVPTVPDEVINKLQEIKSRRGKLGTEDCLALLKVRLNQLKHAFVCIDAVDELEAKVRRELLKVLKELSTNHIRLFLTGRQHVESEVQKCLEVAQGYGVVISASQQDIEVFLRQQIRDDPYVEDAMDAVLEKNIIVAILEKSQGMFLLPTLHIKMILEMPTIAERQEALEVLPTDLYESFRSIITRIKRRPKAYADLGLRVLMWLHFARRPLQIVELQHALAVKKSHVEFDDRNIPSQRVLLDCCLGLVLVDEETLTVRFMHFTLEEYFRENAGNEFPDGCSSIAETCLTYLNFGGLRQHCTNPDILLEKSTKYAFLQYAALYWGTYVKQQCTDNLTKLAGVILEHEGEHPPCAIQALYSQVQKHQWGITQPAKKFLGVHAMAYFGLSENLAKFYGVELKDDNGRTPLSWAAGSGNEGVVRLLIERDGVYIDAKDKLGRTPFMRAVGSGHEAVVRLLIERDGVDINAKDNRGRTPLLWAAENGNEAVVRLLIERDGVDINAKDNKGRTPLLWAAENGNEAVVRLLVERDGIDIASKNNEGRTPLFWAVYNGHEAVVRLLVERGDVDIDAKDDEGMTPFMYAALSKHEAVVRLLVERGGVDIDAKDKQGKTPLMWAAICGNEAVVELLVESYGVDIDTKDNEGRTPLMHAATRGHDAIVRLLVESYGVDIDAQDNKGRTPFMCAAFYGNEAVVRLLVERDGVDINAKDKKGKTPLMWAAENGSEAVVRLLVECYGVDVNVKDNEGNIAVWWALEGMSLPWEERTEGYEAIVRLLSDRGDVRFRRLYLQLAGLLD